MEIRPVLCDVDKWFLAGSFDGERRALWITLPSHL